MIDPSDSEQILKRQSAELEAMTQRNLEQLQQMLNEQTQRAEQIEKYEHSLTAAAKVQMPSFEMPTAPPLPTFNVPQPTLPQQVAVPEAESVPTPAPMPSGLPPIPKNIPPTMLPNQSWQMPNAGQETETEEEEEVYIDQDDTKESSISAYHIIIGIIIIVFFLRCS